MNQGDAEREGAMEHPAELSAVGPRLPLARLFSAAILIGLGQGTLVALHSMAEPQPPLPELLYGPIDVLAKVTLLLLALVTAAGGFTFVCLQSGGVRPRSTDVMTKGHARRRWFS